MKKKENWIRPPKGKQESLTPEMKEKMKARRSVETYNEMKKIPKSNADYLEKMLTEICE